MEIKESIISLRTSLANTTEDLTDEQLGAAIRRVLLRAMHAETEFMEEKEVDESEFFYHEDSIVRVTAKLLWSDVKLLRLEPID